MRKQNSPSVSMDSEVSTPYVSTNRLMYLSNVQATSVWTLHFCQFGGGVRNPDLTSCGIFTSHALCVRMWQGSWDSSTSGSCFDLPHPFPPPGRSTYVPGTHLRNSPKITPSLNFIPMQLCTSHAQLSSDTSYLVCHTLVSTIRFTQSSGFDVVFANVFCECLTLQKEGRHWRSLWVPLSKGEHVIQNQSRFFPCFRSYLD